MKVALLCAGLLSAQLLACSDGGSATIDSGVASGLDAEPSDSGLRADAGQAADAAGADASATAPDASAPDAGQSQAAEVQAYTTQFFDALCSWLIRCETKLGAAALSQTQCHPLRRAAVEANYLDLLGRGLLRFDAAEAQRCLTALSGAACQIGAVDLRQCDRALRGTVSEGEPCGSTLACAEGICALEASCPGHCRALAVDAACADNSECLYPNVCRGGTCQAPSGLGGACERRTHCAAPLLCGSNRFCEAPAPSGSVCVYALGGDTCAGVQVCRMNGAARSCGAGAAIDAACSGSEPCAPGGRCVEGHCLQTAGPGEACTRSEQCIGLHVCRGDRCVPSAVLGAACDADLPCAQGACVNGTCALLGDGETCSTDTAFGECSGFCAGSRCRARLAANASCRSSGECGAGLECREAGGPAQCLPDCSR